MKTLDLNAIEKRALAAAQKKTVSKAELVSFLKDKSDTVVPAAEVYKMLSGSKKVHVKYGVDPTAADIHLGHMVQLLVLREIQKAGHKVTFVVGDFTATIGDPSGRKSERPQLTEADVKQNVKTYEKQAALVLNMHKISVRFNSEWLEKLSLRELFGYLQQQTVASAMEREDFRKRKSITRAEMLYATLQAIDSIELKADLELGGRDQLLNFLEARDLMRKQGMTGQVVLTTPLLPGTTGTGEKMSKSKNNYIAVRDSARDIYGKVMSVTDKDMFTYLKLLTHMSVKDRTALERAVSNKSINPKDVKQLVARLITRLIHPNQKEVAAAEASFARVFSGGGIPKNIASKRVAQKEVATLPDLLISVFGISKSEAKRLIKSKSVRLMESSGEKTLEDMRTINKGTHVLKLGKRRFIKIIIL